MKKQLITLLFISFTVIMFSQTINVRASFVGRHCPGGSGPCGIIREQNKSISNTQIIFNKENNELIFELSKSKLDSMSKLKLTNNELEKGFYLYNFDEDYELPIEILNGLNIQKKTKIKQGNYLVKDQNGKLILKVKLK